MRSLTQIAVPFHNAELYVVEHKGQPYTLIQTIVEGMGLDWKRQFVKLKQCLHKVWWKSPYLQYVTYI
ncbi:phage antirepressor N-terminal domain-containing protein [Acinetobacter sp. CFCC 11171]|uniref:phage antirepressor N-terminal domain-containing protein n=1 Tax=Acinetobacter sp. CFCC 11171 TaxID=1775558 RepID=UPI000DCFB296